MVLDSIEDAGTIDVTVIISNQATPVTTNNAPTANNAPS
jgi:hypothetical protein